MFPKRRTSTPTFPAWSICSSSAGCAGMGERLITVKAFNLLRLLGLESWRHSPISAYSKGMKQRVLIAAR